MRHFFSLIFLGIVINISGQTLLSDIIDPNFRNHDLLFKYGEYDGTPYLLEEDQPVEIHTSLHGIITQEKANFDIYDQKLVVQTDDKEIVVNNNQILFFIIQNEKGAKMKFVKQVSNKEVKYYEAVHEGRLNIYREYSKKFERPNENVDHNYGGEVSEKPYFSRVKLTYFMNFDGSDIVKTALSKNAVEKILPSEYKRKYKQLLKKNKVSFKREEELKSFLLKLETEFKE